MSPEYCDNWIHSAIRYDGQPEAATLSDWCYSGLGPQWGPGEPQRAATPEQTARGQDAWKRMIDKARRIIESDTEDQRLMDYVASHRPTVSDMATFTQQMEIIRWRIPRRKP